MTSDWDAARYSRFEDQRTRPVRDLLARAVSGGPVRTAVDAGCGPGNSTQALAEACPDAVIAAFDNSPEMVRAARARLGAGITVDLASVSGWTAPAPVDLILSNAVLQWVPDHETLFPHLLNQLAPGGRLAVQMPDNLDEPVHRLIQQVAERHMDPATRSRTAASRPERHDARWYHQLLSPLAAVDVWRTTYYHPLAGPAAVVDWFRGAGLRPWLDALDEKARPAFLTDYENEIASAYPAAADGTVLLPFPRLFIVARVAG
ncbi:methyltransferase domain-containing protein [Paracoccus pacificus]|uniref:Methyltransferase domain-containing protein n=1 Tax=Paracoccus pacificus TaxID=1463598 RepID=A0ABW4R7M3_9RHOB